MTFRSQLLRFGAGIAAAAAAIALVHETTRAQSTSEVLFACYVPSSGTVYRIQVTDAPTDCVDPAHLKFSWNAQGPAGPQGPVGAAGTNGTNGAPGTPGTNGTNGLNGANGVSGWEKIVVAGTIDDAGGGSVEAACPGSKKVLGGGFSSAETSNESNIMFSRPNDAGTGWLAGWNRQGDFNPAFPDPRSLTVYAICATVT